MKRSLREFKAFLLRGSIVTVAIAFVMAVAFKALVDAIVANLVTPIVGSLSSGGIGDVLRIHLRGSNYIRLGLILDAVIVFTTTAAAVFFLIIKPLTRFGVSLDDESK